MVETEKLEKKVLQQKRTIMILTVYVMSSIGIMLYNAF